MNEDNPRMVRWRLALSAYDFEVVYKPGPQQRVADELSRTITEEYAPPPDDDGEGVIPCLMVGVEDEELITPPTFPREGPIVEVPEAMEAPTIDEVRAAQTRHTWCQDLLLGMECGAPYSRFSDLIWDKNGILSCKSAINEEFLPRWAAPAEIRENILTLGHYRYGR
jgi:hypothetical protein